MGINDKTILTTDEKKTHTATFGRDMRGWENEKTSV
jgi:hypothetical protein